MQKIVLREKKYYDIDVDGREVKVKILGDNEKITIMKEYGELEKYNERLDKGIKNLDKKNNVKAYLDFSEKIFKEITEKQVSILKHMINEEDIEYFINEYQDIEIIDRLIVSLLLEVQRINVDRRKEFIKQIKKEVK